MADQKEDRHFRQYALLVESADRASERRQANNSVLLTLSSALVASWGVGATAVPTTPRVAIAIVGILVAAVWWSLLDSHQKLNAAKFTVILELEASLPQQPLAREWDELQGRGYREVTRLEGWLPGLFVALHVALVVATLAQ